MNETKFTPGPWAQEDSGDGLWVTGPNRNEPAICDLLPRDADVFTDEDEANANLIASAPYLYAELERLVRLLGPSLEAGLHVPGLATLNGPKAALAKARGEK